MTHRVRVADIIAALKRRGRGLWVPIGYSRRGLECVNLAEDHSSHILIGGATGGGKSTLLRMIMVVLHILYTPKDVLLWVCDFKHGIEMSILGRNPMLFTRTLSDPNRALLFFRELYAEIQRRNLLFAKYEGVNDITRYNRKVRKSECLPRIVLFIDELAKLQGDDVSLKLLRDITGDGRSAGVHVILSVFRPVHTIVDGTLKNNLPVTVAFWCNPVSARVLLGEDKAKSASLISADIGGRALLDYRDSVLVQIPWFSPEIAERLMVPYQKPSLILDEALTVIQEA